LRRKEYSICVAGGESKHRVIRAGLRAGYFNVLITDEKAASYLLKNG
jgi:DNA-binding transcriptional regulator LsrR (DeoR family)